MSTKTTIKPKNGGARAGAGRKKLLATPASIISAFREVGLDPATELRDIYLSYTSVEEKQLFLDKFARYMFSQPGTQVDVTTTTVTPPVPIMIKLTAEDS